MLKFYVSNLFRNKTRTFLSMLGIIIGVAAIIALVSIVDGMFEEVSNAVAHVQGIRVLKKESAGPFSYIDEEWAQKIENISGVRVALPIILGVATSIDGAFSRFGQARVAGIDYSAAQKLIGSPLALAMTGEIIEGRDIKPGEKGVAVIGEQLKKDYKKFLNQKIEINKKEFKIVGVYSAGSALLNSGFAVPLGDARDLFNTPAGKISALMVELNDPALKSRVVQIINFRFGSDLEAFSASDLSEQFGGILGMLRLLAGAVAGISAIVAGVGIINAMLMSVIERFKEIGALKSVGWANSDILKMVMIESIFIGIIGGLIGLVLGSLVSLSLNHVFGLNVAITPVLLLEAFAFAVFLGLIAGVYPAYIAAKMDPVEALRAE